MLCECLCPRERTIVPVVGGVSWHLCLFLVWRRPNIPGLVENPRKRLVVHFDHLKPCSTGAQTTVAENLSAPESTNPPPVDSSSDPGNSRSLPIGAGLEVVEPADDSHAGQQHQPLHQLPVPTRPSTRYPSRNRLPLNRYRDLDPIWDY